MKEYKLLNPEIEEDLDKIREYAEAQMELRILESRRDFLNDIIVDNSELSRSVWTTLEGKAIAIHDLDDDHLKNIATYLNTRGQSNQRVREECIKRFNEPLVLSARLLDTNF